MKIRADRATLAESLAWVAQAIPRRPQVPVLAGMRLSAAENALTLRCFDYETSHMARVACEVADDGEALVSGHFVREIIAALKGAEVELVLDGDRLTITSGRSTYRTQVMRLDEHPALPGFPDEIGSIDSDALRALVDSVDHAVLRDMSVNLPALTGLHIAGEAGTLTVSSTDRHRLAINHAPYAGSDFVALPPATAVQAALKGMGGTVRLGYGNGLFGIADEHRAVTTRCIEADFPRLARLIPDAFPVTATLDPSALSEAVKRAALSSESGAVLLTVTAGEVVVTAESESTGGAEPVACQSDGEAGELVSAPLLIDALIAAPSSEASLRFTNRQQISVELADHESLQQLVMTRRQR